MRKKVCEKCNNEFALKGGNYNRHVQSCDGSFSRTEKGVCKYCDVRFELDDKPSGWMANHTRWCDLNPNKQMSLDKSKNCPQLHTKQAREKCLAGIREAHKNGKYKGSVKLAIETRRKNGTLKHTEESKQLLREKALASNHRRILRSTRKYVKLDGTEVLLDSSWEESLAKRLDSLLIDWIRPDPIKWIDDEGKSHNYFPDFYLTKHEIYLDPKNDIVYNMSLKKIEKIQQILPNLRILRSLEECENFLV